MRRTVIRFLAAFFLGALAACGEDQLNPPPVAPVPPATVTPPRSVIAVASDPRVLEGFEEDAAVSRAMVEHLVQALAQKPSAEAAWREFAGPGDRVGIKVTTAGGPYFSTRRGVVAAVVAGLRNAGVKEVFVWDKDAASLRAAGFTSATVGCDVRSIDPPRGWDRSASFQAPVLGKLIWGDLLFNEKVTDRTSDPLSSKSHLALLLSRDCTKFINIPALSDEPGCGVAGAIHSAVIANVDNWRRFTTFGEGGAASAAELYVDPRIGGKCVLHILDALAVTYAGGPGANPQYAFPHATLYASRDPIALDATGLRLIEKWRAEAKLGPIGNKAAWIGAASAVGNSDEKLIAFRRVP
jgi:uncharacterized protein (DUF362 family)